MITPWHCICLSLMQLIPHQLELCKTPFLVTSVHPHPDAIGLQRARGAGVDLHTFQVNVWGP